MFVLSPGANRVPVTASVVGKASAQGVLQWPSATLTHWCTMIYTVCAVFLQKPHEETPPAVEIRCSSC